MLSLPSLTFKMIMVLMLAVSALLSCSMVPEEKRNNEQVSRVDESGLGESDENLVKQTPKEKRQYAIAVKTGGVAKKNKLVELNIEEIKKNKDSEIQSKKNREKKQVVTEKKVHTSQKNIGIKKGKESNDKVNSIVLTKIRESKLSESKNAELIINNRSGVKEDRHPVDGNVNENTRGQLVTAKGPFVAALNNKDSAERVKSSPLYQSNGVNPKNKQGLDLKEIEVDRPVDNGSDVVNEEDDKLLVDKENNLKQIDVFDDKEKIITVDEKVNKEEDANGVQDEVISEKVSTESVSNQDLFVLPNEGVNTKSVYFIDEEKLVDEGKFVNEKNLVEEEQFVNNKIGFTGSNVSDVNKNGVKNGKQGSESVLSVDAVSMDAEIKTTSPPAANAQKYEMVSLGDVSYSKSESIKEIDALGKKNVNEADKQSISIVKEESVEIEAAVEKGGHNSSSFVIIKDGKKIEKIPAIKVDEVSLKQSLLNILLLDWERRIPDQQQIGDERYSYCLSILQEMRKGQYQSFSRYTIDPENYNQWKQHLRGISLIQLYNQPLIFYRLDKKEGDKQGGDINVVQTVFETDTRLSKMLLGSKENSHFFSGLIAFDNERRESKGGIGRFQGKQQLPYLEWHIFDWHGQYYGLRLQKNKQAYSLLEIIPLFYTQQDLQRNCRWVIES